MENNERIGDLLKRVREERNITIEYLEEKTKISKKLIRAIEDSNFEQFPGDLYLYGFIANISEELRLNSEEIIEQFKKEQKVNLYRTGYSPNLEAPDEETPENQSQAETLNLTDDDLTGAPTRLRLSPVSIAIMAFFLLSGGLLLYFYFSESDFTTTISPGGDASTTEHIMVEEKANFELKKKDTVKIFIDNVANILTLNEIQGEQVSFALNTRNYTLGFGENRLIDVENDSKDDVEVKLNGVSGEKAFFQITKLNYEDDKVDFQAIWDSSSPQKVTEQDFTLFQNKDKFPISIYIKAVTAPSQVEWNKDGQSREIKMLNRGEYIIVLAEDHLLLNLGNYRDVILLVNQQPLSIQLKSEAFATTKIIKWIRNPENETKFDLIIQDSIY